jgi:hypothetical protein
MVGGQWKSYTIIIIIVLFRKKILSLLPTLVPRGW